MKNTAETLILPDFLVTLVQKIANETIESKLSLVNWIKDSQKGLILYFYPKDNTQGCTIQAVDFTKNLSKLAEKGYIVIGVSPDDVSSHKKFIQKHDLQIGLISDIEKQLCYYFDVFKEKQLYGKKYFGVVRSTFIFDNQGKILASYRNVKAKEHVQNLLAVL